MTNPRFILITVAVVICTILNGCNRGPIRIPGDDMHASQPDSIPVNRPIAMGIIEPIQPGEIRPYPVNKNLILLRSPKEQNVLGKPDYYDPENDVYVHSIYLSQQQYAHLVASYGRVPAVPTLDQPARRPAIETDLADVMDDTEAILDMLTEHPQLLGDMFLVDAFAGDPVLIGRDGGIIQQDHPGGGGAAAIPQEALPRLSLIENALAIILDESVPARLRQTLLAKRQDAQALAVQEILKQGGDSYKALFDESWTFLRAQTEDDVITKVLEGWMSSHALWTDLQSRFVDGMTPPYADVAKHIEQHALLLRSMQKNPRYEAFSAGKLLDGDDALHGHYARVRRQMVRAYSQLAQLSLAVVRVYQPLRFDSRTISPPLEVYGDATLD